jgi:hypothetical protein
MRLKNDLILVQLNGMLQCNYYDLSKQFTYIINENYIIKSTKTNVKCICPNY